jgi:hypothetical protein
MVIVSGLLVFTHRNIAALRFATRHTTASHRPVLWRIVEA